jgi:hypothetical protein
MARIKLRAFTVAGLTATAIVGSALASSAFASTTATAPKTTWSKTIAISNDQDSSAQGGNWAVDKFARHITLHRVGAAPVTDCAAGSARCWQWSYKVSDSGTFTTIAGAVGPREGVEDQSLTGSFNGGTPDAVFFSNQDTANPSLAPASISSGVGTGFKTTSSMPRLFFPRGAGTTYTLQTLGDWGWTYQMGFDVNSQCPNFAYRWVDSNANQGGSAPADGNILTDNTADCGTVPMPAPAG